MSDPGGIPEDLAAEITALMEAADRYRSFIKLHYPERLAGIIWCGDDTGMVTFCESRYSAAMRAAIRDIAEPIPTHTRPSHDHQKDSRPD